MRPVCRPGCTRTERRRDGGGCVSSTADHGLRRVLRGDRVVLAEEVRLTEPAAHCAHERARVAERWGSAGQRAGRGIRFRHDGTLQPSTSPLPNSRRLAGSRPDRPVRRCRDRPDRSRRGDRTNRHGDDPARRSPRVERSLHEGPRSAAPPTTDGEAQCLEALRHSARHANGEKQHADVILGSRRLPRCDRLRLRQRSGLLLEPRRRLRVRAHAGSPGEGGGERGCTRADGRSIRVVLRSWLRRLR